MISSSNKNFRYDINALRAIAVISVLLFHYKIKYFTGGFSGVDIFFVISGYLMTRIIYNAVVKNDFSFVDFYGRRLKRIVPALLFLVLCLAAACFFFYFPDDYRLVVKNAASSLLFLSNILYWQSVDYFAASSADNILLHTWSLSVEWQFYLLYPLLFLLLNRFFKRKTSYLISFIILALALLMLAIIVSDRNQTASFYLLPTRSWEMLFGGIAFFSEDFIKNFKWRKYLAIAGYCLIIYGIATLTSNYAWPGKYTLLPVVATFLVIAANYNEFKIPKNGVVQFFGKISYSLYLWHWPLFVIAAYLGIELTKPVIVAMVAIAIALAYFSYRYIESFNYKSNVKILVIGFSLTGVMILLNCYDFNSKIFKSSTVAISAYQENHEKERKEQFNDVGGCSLSSNNETTFNKQLCLSYDDDKKNFLLIGDSHAAQLSQSLRDAFFKKGVHLMQANASGCFPTLKTRGRRKCTDLVNYVYKDFIPNNNSKIDAVLIGANWVSKIKNTAALAKDIQTTIDFFERYHIKVVLIGQNEGYDMRYPFIAAKENEYSLDFTHQLLDKNTLEINKFLSKSFAAYYVDIYNYTTVPKVVNNTPYMFDRDHLTKYGADVATNKIIANPIVVNLLNNPNKALALNVKQPAGK